MHWIEFVSSTIYCNSIALLLLLLSMDLINTNKDDDIYNRFICSCIIQPRVPLSGCNIDMNNMIVIDANDKVNDSET